MAKTPWLKVPSAAIQQGALVPLGICPRHGLPAVRSKKRTYYTASPAWAVLIVLVSVLIGLLVIALMRKTVAGPVPDCATCVSDQKRRTAIGWSIALLSVGLLLASLGQHSAAFVLVALIAVLVALVFPVVAPKKWAYGVVTDDGWWVQLKRTAPAFDAAVQQAMAAASPPTVTPPA